MIIILGRCEQVNNINALVVSMINVYRVKICINL